MNFFSEILFDKKNNKTNIIVQHKLKINKIKTNDTHIKKTPKVSKPII